MPNKYKYVEKKNPKKDFDGKVVKNDDPAAVWIKKSKGGLSAAFSSNRKYVSVDTTARAGATFRGAQLGDKFHVEVGTSGGAATLTGSLYDHKDLKDGEKAPPTASTEAAPRRRIPKPTAICRSMRRRSILMRRRKFSFLDRRRHPPRLAAQAVWETHSPKWNVKQTLDMP